MDKPRIFISHAWEDKALVRHLEAELKAAGADVWVDHAGIRGGDILPERISNALDWCNTLLLIWSKAAAGSRWVKLEWTNAIVLQKLIIPCKIDGTPVPSILANTAYIDFSNREQGSRELLRALQLAQRGDVDSGLAGVIHDRLSQAAPPTILKPPQRIATIPLSWRSLLQKALAGVGVLLLTIFIAYLLSRRQGNVAQPADFALLSITTTPVEATVILDGNAIGKTPLKGYRANAGRFAVRIQKPPDYFPFDTTLTLVKGREAQFYFKLKPALARVTIQVNPNDAEVILDGGKLAAAQLRNQRLAPGLHRLTISRQGYQTLQTQFQLTARDTTLAFSLNPEIVAEYGIIRVQAFSDGRIFIDGNLIGNITAGEIREYNQTVGSHKVELLSANGNFTKYATVAKGAAAMVKFEAPNPPLEIKPARRYTLRSTPRNNFSEADVKQMLGAKSFYDKYWNINGSGLANDYEMRTIAGKKVVVDKATGLIWQQSGSSNSMSYADAEKYIHDLNAKRFAGYNDWHLPTLEDAMSLMEPKQYGNLYIDPIFNRQQMWIWTADKESAGRAWVVHFNYGGCNHLHVGNFSYVRAVRSGQLVL